MLSVAKDDNLIEVCKNLSKLNIRFMKEEDLNDINKEFLIEREDKIINLKQKVKKLKNANEEMNFETCDCE